MSGVSVPLRKETPQEELRRAYVTGFVFSIVLTVCAYLFVDHHLLHRNALIAVVVCLALAQFVTQLIYFLHLGKEPKPRWKLGVFLFMLMVAAILIFGSLWIMANLNSRMSPDQMNQYMTNQDGL